MRFVLYDQKTNFKFDVVDDNDNVVFESQQYPDQSSATEAINKSIDSLRDQSRYMTDGDDVKLVDSAGEVLMNAKIPSGTAPDRFIAERVADASDQDKFSVQVNAKGKKFGSSGPPVAPSREEMTSHYNYALSSVSPESGVNEVGTEAPYYFIYYNAAVQPILYSRDLPNATRRKSAIRSLLRYAKEKYVERWEDGKVYYFRVVSPQGFELGRSPGFNSDADRSAAIEYYLTTAHSHKEAFAKTTRGQKLKQQEYLLDRPSDSKQPGFEEFKAENKKHYFTYNDESGVPLLHSQGYRGGKARDTGLRSVIKNGLREDRYRIKEKNGNYSIVLLAGNNQEIGRSRSFEQEANAIRYRDYLIEKFGAEVTKYGIVLGAANTQSITASSEFEITRDIPKEQESYTPNAQREQDNYLVCSAYEDRIKAGDSVHPKHSDIVVFQHENGLYYFATVLNGEVGLRSEGYPTTGARDNGLKSVLRFREKRSRYKIEENRGFYFTCLTAQNGQEIGRSCPKKSADTAQGLWPALGAAALAAQAAREAAEQKPAAAPESYVPNAAREQDNYLVCSAYEDRIAAGDSVHPKHSDVVVFQHENGLYYFATVQNGEVGLRSEGYPTTGARDNGLKSVLRFREKRTRYKIEENRGFYFTCLTAQNGQEIGRSCPRKSEESAQGLWPAMGAAALAAQAAREVSEPKTDPSPEPYTPNAEREQDNYLVCSAYQDRITAGDAKHHKHDDVIVFQHDNGLYYFATVKAGEVALRSEGYPTTGARDNGLKSVLRFREKRNRFKHEEIRGLHFTYLTAQNGQEIGRSCPKKTEALALGLWPALGAASLAAAATAAASKIETTPSPAEEPLQAAVPSPPKEKEDDYLACKEYRGRKMNDKKNLVSLFKHENGQYYFAILDRDKNVRLRSEGFPDAKKRDQELSGALRFIDDESKYERIQRGKFHINVLRDETGREVGRSCAEREPKPFIPIAAIAAAAPIAVATAVSSPPPPSPPVPPKEEAVVPPPIAAAATKGGCAWWMWLLAALLLLGLLWYFLKGCNSTAKPETASVAQIETQPTPEPAPAVAPAPEPESASEPEPTSEPEVVAPAPIAQSCNCNSLTHPVFDVPNGKKPNNITKLGRAPEFGNSHSLDATGFYQKLNRRAGQSATDKRFLDGVARAMGYSNGFAGLSADKFSSVTLKRGTLGNLGSTASHKTIYAQLNTSGRDLEAFKIEAANGCHLHFMKTCGNHMFFCSK